MRIVSWNVNGIRSAARQGLETWWAGAGDDLLLMQEVRALPEQMDAAIRDPGGHVAHWHAAERKGYSGVGSWSRRPIDRVTMGLGLPAFDIEGRAQILEVEGLRIYNLYVPNGGRDHERVPYKLAFYEALLADLNPRLERGEALVVVGDFNTAHRPIDLSNPKANERTTGFLPEERAWVDRFLATGLRDVFRDAHPDESGHHTWWSNRPGIRQRNIGWRIDYFLVSPAVLPRVRSATIRPEVMGSDHCPIALELD